MSAVLLLVGEILLMEPQMDMRREMDRGADSDSGCGDSCRDCVVGGVEIGDMRGERG